MRASADEFRRALGQFASGVTVVTTRSAEGQPLGLTVSSFCSVSLDPPLVLVCVDARSETNPGFRSSGVFGVSVLSEGQQAWSRRFASGGASKFDGVEMMTGKLGLALVPGALAYLECRLSAAYDAGDHALYVGEVVELSANPGRPLVYHGSAYGELAADDCKGDGR
jgi:flavin reductase (DIM6/NTAB) family NADH-FMN oxidoreductase RutF